MDFDLNDEQKEIKRVANELLASRSPFAKVREAAEAGAYDPALWNELVELGWPGIAVSAEHGGQELGAVGLAVLLEELGYACAATPFFSTATAAAVIQATGTPEQRSRWLPALAAGEATAGIGTRELAADASDAAVIVLLDGDEALLLDRGDADVSPLVSIDPTRRFATVAGDGQALAAGAADRVRAALAAELVGVCQRALDMTLEYVKDRKQFGVPVGSFQAVSHRCAQMLLHTESARSAAYFAAWAADDDPDRLPEAGALAAASAADGGREVTASAIQAHGGIGFTWEADVHWLYKRAQLDSALLGGAKRHRAALARIGAARVGSSVAAG
ncbi:MAG TPA: acyl-CoA dehydrogenase family protein [Solirubrobacteraceae bacterium]|nr:acyl-CoA dehydrogenase family protein [Solirubrobacteraceae bacterium]